MSCQLNLPVRWDPRSTEPLFGLKGSWHYISIIYRVICTYFIPQISKIHSFWIRQHGISTKENTPTVWHSNKLCGFIVHNKDPCPNVQYARLRCRPCVFQATLVPITMVQLQNLVNTTHHSRFFIDEIWTSFMLGFLYWYLHEVMRNSKVGSLPQKMRPREKAPKWRHSKCGKKKHKTQLSIYISYILYIYIYISLKFGRSSCLESANVCLLRIFFRKPLGFVCHWKPSPMFFSDPSLK